MSGELSALLSALAWASSSVLMTVSAKRMHVVSMNLVRSTVAVVFYLALLPFFGGFKALAAIPLANLPWLVLSVLMVQTLGDTLFFSSMHLAGVSRAMPVASINPLWVVLLAALFVGEPLSWTLAVGTVLVVSGTVLVSRSSSDSALTDGLDRRSVRKGLVLAFAVSMLWAVGQVSLKPASGGISVILVNNVRQPLAAVFLLGITVVRGRWGELGGLDRTSWVVLLVAGLLSAGIAGLFFIVAIQRIGAGRTAVLTSVAPILALPFSIIWLGERPTRRTVAGTLLTVVGIALVV